MCIAHGTDWCLVSGASPHLGQVSSSSHPLAVIINDASLDTMDISVFNLSSSPTISFHRKEEQAQKG